MPADRVTAAVLLIGDEILSGRTQDTNLGSIARFLGPLGVQVAEARVVPDVHERIVEALNDLRGRNDYVFTTGGIGPTHDDITADAIAAAFERPVEENAKALEILRARYAERGETLTDARRRMARMPQGARLIDNPVSGAPGFQVDNVFVLAGVPGIMKGMLQDVGPRIEGGEVTASRSVRAAALREGDIGGRLGELQSGLESVALGSYPYFRGPDDYGVVLVARSADEAALAGAVEALEGLIRDAGGDPEEIDESA